VSCGTTDTFDPGGWVRRETTLVLAVTLCWAAAARAQTLSSRPAFFCDPVLAVDPAYGELVLGRTTLRSAMRIFATELQDSLRIAPGRRVNPDTLPLSRTDGPGMPPALRFRLDVGSGRYTLYFDKNERLVAVQAGARDLPRPLRREDLVARYATLRPVSRLDMLGNLEAPLGPCISMVASAGEGNDIAPGAPQNSAPGTILSFGYRFTCPTLKPEPRAVQSVR